MTDSDPQHPDFIRMTKLKELAAAGKIGGGSSYFNHLIDIYGETGRLSANRSFTDRERARVDRFLDSFGR